MTAVKLCEGVSCQYQSQTCMEKLRAQTSTSWARWSRNIWKSYNRMLSQVSRKYNDLMRWWALETNPHVIQVTKKMLSYKYYRIEMGPRSHLPSDNCDTNSNVNCRVKITILSFLLSLSTQARKQMKRRLWWGYVLITYINCARSSSKKRNSAIEYCVVRYLGWNEENTLMFEYLVKQKNSVSKFVCFRLSNNEVIHLDYMEIHIWYDGSPYFWALMYDNRCPQNRQQPCLTHAFPSAGCSQFQVSPCMSSPLQLRVDEELTVQ